MATCTFAFFATMTARLAPSPLIPQITSEFGISNTMIGFGLTGMWLMYGVAQYPSGILANKYGDRKIISLALGGTAVASLLIIVVPLYVVFVLLIVFMGWFAGLHYSVASSLLSRKYQEVGFSLGVHNFGGTLGGFIVPIAVTWISSRVGWRPAMLFVTVTALLALFLFVYSTEPTPPREPNLRILSEIQLDSLFRVLKQNQIYASVFVVIIVSFVWQGTATFLPTFLVEYHGYTSATAGFSFAVFFLIQGVIQIGTGIFSDRYNQEASMVSCLFLGIVGFMLLLFPSGIFILFVALILAGIGLGAFTIALAILMEVIPSEERNTSFGLIQSINLIIASSGSTIIGLISDRAGWGPAFLLMGILFVIVFLVTTLRMYQNR